MPLCQAARTEVRNLPTSCFRRPESPDSACAAASTELHERELEIINMIYCHVMSADEVLGYLPG